MFSGTVNPSVRHAHSCLKLAHHPNWKSMGLETLLKQAMAAKVVLTEDTTTTDSGCRCVMNALARDWYPSQDICWFWETFNK